METCFHKEELLGNTLDWMVTMVNSEELYKGIADAKGETNKTIFSTFMPNARSQEGLDFSTWIQ